MTVIDGDRVNLRQRLASSQIIERRIFYRKGPIDRAIIRVMAVTSVPAAIVIVSMLEGMAATMLMVMSMAVFVPSDRG